MIAVVFVFAFVYAFASVFEGSDCNWNFVLH